MRFYFDESGGTICKKLFRPAVKNGWLQVILMADIGYRYLVDKWCFKMVSFSSGV